MTEAKHKERLEALSSRIDALKQSQAPAPATPDAHAQAHLAWRMVIELVAGLAIGFGIGYGLDALLGTGPWLMIIFILLGFAAGIRTMMRSAKEVQAEQEAAAAAEKDTPGE